MKNRKPRIWKVENGEFVEISPEQLEAEDHFLTEEDVYRLARKLIPPSLNEKNQ